MKQEKRQRLEASGWRVGGVEEFLGLTAEEAALVEVRIRLADAVRALRQRQHLTQVQLAEKLGSSQSRVAKVEAAEDSVSLDLLIRSFLALDASPEKLAAAIAQPSARRLTTTV